MGVTRFTALLLPSLSVRAQRTFLLDNADDAYVRVPGVRSSARERLFPPLSLTLFERELAFLRGVVSTFSPFAFFFRPRPSGKVGEWIPELNREIE